jgi:hypothetical protein
MPSIRSTHIASSVAALTCAVVVAGCGSSDPAGHARVADVASRRSEAVAYSQCMRSSGVPNFPDPQTAGSAVSITLKSSSGINPASPSFQAAQASCARLLPGGGPGSVKASAATERQMLVISECMRAHGIGAFPDPTTAPPSTPAGYSGVLTRDGVSFAIPATINIESPAVQQAASACHLGGLGQGGTGGGSP